MAGLLGESAAPETSSKTPNAVTDSGVMMMIQKRSLSRMLRKRKKNTQNKKKRIRLESKRLDRSELGKGEPPTRATTTTTTMAT